MKVMKRIVVSIAGGLLIGGLAASYAKLPPPTPEEKAAAAAKKEKEAVAKEKAAKDLAKAQDRAVENYKMNQNRASTGATMQPQPQQPPQQAPR